MIRTVSLLILTLMPYAAASAAALATQSAKIFDVATRAVDTGGTATLQREDDILRLNLDVVGLEPGNAYVLYVVVFNNPRGCQRQAFDHCDFKVDSNGQGGNPGVTSTTAYLTGGVADADGNVRFNGKLERGATGLVGREVLDLHSALLKDHFSAIFCSISRTLTRG